MNIIYIAVISHLIDGMFLYVRIYKKSDNHMTRSRDAYTGIVIRTRPTTPLITRTPQTPAKTRPLMAEEEAESKPLQCR